MIRPCEGQTSKAFKLGFFLIGVILSCTIKYSRGHQKTVAYISSFSELLQSLDSGSGRRSQHFVLTSHIDIEPETRSGRPKTSFQVNGTVPYSDYVLSLQGNCSEPPPQEWSVHGTVASGQCVLRFSTDSGLASNQVILIEGNINASVNVWIANLYIIAARLVDVQRSEVSPQVSLWTNNVTLQDTPTIASIHDELPQVLPPHNERHDGAIFIKPCGPPLTTLGSTACFECLVQGCRTRCIGAAARRDCSIAVPSAVAAFADVGTGNLFLQEFTVQGCQHPVADIIPHACGLAATDKTGAPDALNLCVNSMPAASVKFNDSVVNATACGGSFLPAENPALMDLQLNAGFSDPSTVNASESAPSENGNVFAATGQHNIAPAQDRSGVDIPPPVVQSAAGDEPTWVVIGIVIASIAIAVLSLLLLLLLRPCKLHCQPIVRSTGGSVKSTSEKSTLTQPVDTSDVEHRLPQSPATEQVLSQVEGGASLIAVASRNAVDCGRPDARSADWECDPNMPEAAQARVQLSQHTANVLQVSLEQADMYMHHSLGHKGPPFRDSSTSAASGRSSLHGMHNHGRPVDSLSAASLSAASAAAASSAAAAAANRRSDSRELQRSLPSGLHGHGNLLHATSTTEPGRTLPQQPENSASQSVRGYVATGVASPQWVHSAGSEASGRGFSLLPRWQEETHEPAPQWRQNIVPQPHGWPQRRRMSSDVQYAYTGPWGPVGPGDSTDVTSFQHAVGSMPPVRSWQTAELFDADFKPLRTAHSDVPRWSAGAEQARAWELVERGGFILDGGRFVPGPAQGSAWISQLRQSPSHQVTVQQRRHQERAAAQYDMHHRDVPRW